MDAKAESRQESMSPQEGMPFGLGPGGDAKQAIDGNTSGLWAGS